ncbi:hypothetical protein FQN60_003435 [Etheostoma spectabile]|uniref:Target of rapamycin complex 2 subunit MAPKAP1 n=1 Tax=Etheostoma spectabile TaxID=54343 RepID=A0A5J5CE26_9PERO|nr:hypothetical protein FQN60_003435 [Etheostoma spectabile]
MAFLDNPAIILAHIRQSHVTSDDTGMCEMVLIDQDVDLEKCQLALVPGSSCGSTGSTSLSEGDSSVTDNHACDLSQSMDITSSWDFGIRRRSNTGLHHDSREKPGAAAEDLGSLFEKRDFKDRPRTTGSKSTLSLRLEQCPQQLNNPFNEYSKFDGKGHIGTTATKKIDVYLSMQMAQEKLHPMTVVTIANARNVNAYCLHIAEDDGEVDTDFPPLDSNEPIHKFGFSTLALVEKYSSPGLASRQSLFVRINAARGFSLIPVDRPLYRLEKQTEPNVGVDLDSTLESQSTLEFCLVRENSSRGEESSEEDPPIDITTVQDMLSSHHYKSFKISMIHKLRFTTDVQLGEKVEIDPVTNQKASTKFWIRQKPISIDSDHLGKLLFGSPLGSIWCYTDHAIFKLTYLSNHDYKPLYFESDAATVNEIVLKVNYILESRASTARADYFAQKQRKLSRRTSFSFQKEKKTGQ